MINDIERLLYVSGNYEVQRLKDGKWRIFSSGQEIKHEQGSIIGSAKMNGWQSLAFIDEDGWLHHDVVRCPVVGTDKDYEAIITELIGGQADELDEMPAGREMDILIAQALGKEVCTCQEAIGLTNAAFPGPPPWGSWYVGDFYLKEDPVPFTGLARLPYYSTDIADAWEVIELLGERDWGRVDISRTKLPPTGYYQCIMYWATQARAVAYGETAPLAISRAALKAARATKAGADGVGLMTE